MPRRMKPEPKPTPNERPEVIEIPPLATVIDERDLPSNVCPICGTIRTTDVCPVDGFRFVESA